MRKGPAGRLSGGARRPQPLVVPPRLLAVAAALHRAPLPRTVLGRVKEQPLAVTCAALAYQRSLRLRREHIRRRAHDRPHDAVQPITRPAPCERAVGTLLDPR